MRPQTDWLPQRPASRRALMAALLSTSLIPTLRADYAAEVMSENPIAYYRFDDGVATDDLPSPAVNIGSAGAGVNGSYAGNFIRGVPGALPGSANTAVQGTGTVVEIANDPVINNSGSFTVEAWLKPTSIPAAGALISPIASFRENDGTYGRAGWLIYQGDANTGFNFRCYNRNGATFTFSITSGVGTVTAGAWHHVVATWDSVANQGKIYVNGVLRGTSAVVAPGGPNSVTYEPNNTRPFTLGSRDGAFPWAGDIDEPAYYTSVLSDAQVLAHYNNGVSPSPSQTYDSLVLADAPVAYWRVGEAAFTPRTPPVADNAGSLGSSADGGYYAGSKNTSAGPNSGGGFLGFDASNSCLSLATGNGYVGTALGLLNNRSAFTVMGWVKRGAVHSTRGGYFGQNDLLEFGDASNGTNIEAWVNARGGNMVTPYTFADDQWGFIVLTGDTSKSTLYLNGTQVAQMTGTLANYGSSAFNFNVGGAIFAATGEYFRGEIDEVAVFDKAVTSGRVKQLYDTALGNVSVGLVDTVPSVTPTGEIPEGQPFTLSIDPTGTPPFTYQWKKNGVDVPGANSQTLVVSAAEANSPVTEPYEYTVVVTNLSGAGTVTSDPALVYVTPALKWTGTDGTSPGTWATTGGTLNWKTFTGGTPAAYTDEYAVIFDDSGTALTATLTEPVQPKGVIVDSDTKNYTITGPHALSTSGGGVVKNGTSTLEIGVDDLFVETVTINEGTLKLGSSMVTGLYSSATVAVNGGTLDIGLPTGTPYVNATTVASGASLVVTGTGDLELSSGSTTIGGAGSEVFNRNGTVLVNMANALGGSVAIQSGTVVFDGNQNANRLAANKLVNVSPGATMTIHGVNALPTAANSVSVALNQATLNVVTGGSFATGAAGQSHAHLKDLNLSASSVVLGYSGGGSAYNGESFQLNGGITVTGSGASTISLGSGANTGNAGIAPSGNATHTVNVANTAVGADLIIDAEIENTDASAANAALSILSKTGLGTLQLADGIAHSFIGTVQVNDGTLEATGSLAGPLTVAAGASVSLGTSVGTLVAGNTTLDGTYRCDINALVSDQLAVNGNLTFGAGAAIALSVGPGGATAQYYELAKCTGVISGPLPILTGTIPPGYTLQVISGSSLVLTQPGLNLQPGVATVTPSGTENFDTSGGGFTVSAPVSPQTDWTYSAGHWLSFGEHDGTGGTTHTSYLSTPIYTVTQAGSVTMSFSHKYKWEVDFDAGAVDISVNGAPFTRLPETAFTSNGYAAEPLATGTNSALAGQKGFLGESPGYPAYHTTECTLLASAAVGDTVQVRFISATDDYFSEGGWEIDSVSITGALPRLMKLEWPLGTMQYSDTLQPPWTDLSGSSPLLIDTMAAPKRFFRLKP